MRIPPPRSPEESPGFFLIGPDDRVAGPEGVAPNLGLQRLPGGTPVLSEPTTGSLTRSSYPVRKLS